MTLYVDRKYYKYTYAAFSQPVLSANGTIGGSSFAVTAVNTDSRTQPYYAFDSNKADTFTAGWLSKASNNYLEWYNPNPLNITKLVIQYQTSAASSVGYISSWKITASNDDTNYVDILSGATSSYGVATITISHTGYYKYWRFYPLAWSSEWYDIIDLQITAQARTGYTESTSSSYDFFRDIKIKEIYNGSQSIGYVYNGSDLVWQHNPYPIGTVIANTQTAGSITIYPGTYELKISGAGGTGGHSGANWGNHNGSGGSGACWEGTIRVENTYTMAWTTGTGAAASVTVSFNGTNMVTAGGGGNAVVNYSTSQGGAAGVITVQSAFSSYIVSTSKSSDGTKGASTAVSWGDYHTAVTAAPSTMGWGVGESSVDGGRTDGGFYLKRIA